MYKYVYVGFGMEWEKREGGGRGCILFRSKLRLLYLGEKEYEHVLISFDMGLGGGKRWGREEPTVRRFVLCRRVKNITSTYIRGLIRGWKERVEKREGCSVTCARTLTQR